MTKKVYRTAQGKQVDLGALQLKNESTRAVGNMGVNARGDRVNAQNKPIDNRTKSVARQYNNQVNKTNVFNDPIPADTKYKKPYVEDTEIQLEDVFVEPEVVEQPKPVAQDPAVEPASTGGLADAIAKAKSGD